MTGERSRGAETPLDGASMGAAALREPAPWLGRAAFEGARTETFQS